MTYVEIPDAEQKIDWTKVNDITHCHLYLATRTRSDDGIHLICAMHRTNLALGFWPSAETVQRHVSFHRSLDERLTTQ